MWAGRHLCSQMAMHSIFCVFSAAQKCTGSSQDLNLDDILACSVAVDGVKSSGASVSIQCQFTTCKTGYYSSTPAKASRTCKANTDKTKAEGEWDPPGCAGA